MKTNIKQQLSKNDKVRVTINKKKREGIVLKKYHDFALIQLKHYKECFKYDEIELIEEETEKILELDNVKIS